jgi:hypothetical protein
MLSILGRGRAACNGINRRQLLEAAGAGLLGLTLPKVLEAQSASAGSPGRARSVIFLFLFGGPSQLETFDMKPDAAQQIRGPFRPIGCRTPGLRICEHLPRLAQVSDKFCVVRTLTHSYNDHSGAGHYLQTGKRWHIPIGGGFSATPHDWPSMGSVVEYLAQRSGGSARDLASYAVVPSRLGRLEAEGQYIRPGEYAGWLGRAYNPLTTVAITRRNATDNPFFRDCTDDELNFQIDGLLPAPELTLDRINSRQRLLHQFDAQRQQVFAGQRPVTDYDRFRQRALVLATSDRTRCALDIRQEPARLRDRYGRHLFGQATLMARRLVEAGVRFVTVHYDSCDGYSWDSHLNSNDVRAHLLPTFDQALGSLLVDLDERGLLAETLVVALGEMGRTPVANSTWGRGHWSTLFPVVLAGAGIRGGSVYGSSDRDAAHPIDNPVTPEDLAATIYHALGIDPGLRLPDQQGRPTPIVETGRPVLGVFG